MFTAFMYWIGVLVSIVFLIVATKTIINWIDPFDWSD